MSRPLFVNAVKAVKLVEALKAQDRSIIDV
jgi:hypothetical protein